VLAGAGDTRSSHLTGRGGRRRRLGAVVCAAAGVLLLGLGGLASATTAPARATTNVTVRIFVPRGALGARCDRVFARPRTVRSPAVLAAAIRELLKGPTAAERTAGYGGWFSTRTAGKLRGVRINAGVAFIDFADFRRIIPNASSSCGSSLLLAQLNRTATQFPTVRRAIYSFNGSRRAFYEWLQYSTPQ
jgi:hypothetical protein